MKSDTEVKVNIKALAPKDDLSVEKDPFFEVYNATLDSAFGNPRIRNLALSGSLGSGKSSIIRSFDRKRNGDQRFLYVSLIDFSKAVAGENGKAYDQKQLEYSLLSQIQSCCTSEDLPEGSIHGIPEKFHFLDFFAKSLTLLCLSAFVLIFHEKFGALAAMFGVPGDLRANAHLMLYLFAAVVLCGCVYPVLRRCLPYLRVSRLLLKSSVAEAEVNLGKERTTLDTHKFELAYILEQIGEKHDHTVVFEDLERLDNAIAVDIMSKLRELNTLTNNHLKAQGSTQPIRFLYAISDSTMPFEYRTKFYDCIIPVIPVSHPLNTRNQFWKMLKALEISDEWLDHLCDALSDAFVDYRTRLSLQNEFQVLRGICAKVCGDKSQKGNNTSTACNEAFLFAVTAYKLLLPECFEHTLSPQGDGILPDLSSPKDEQYLKQNGRTKAFDAVQTLFKSGLLDKTSMRLIVGEEALVEQWLKVIRSALDRDTFDESDEIRIRSITEALQTVFQDICPDPNEEPYADFRKAMAERLCMLTAKDAVTHFVLTANSLAAVSRTTVSADWDWPLPVPKNRPSDFQGFLRNYFSWLDELSGDLKLKDSPNTSNYLKALCKEYPEYQEGILRYAKHLFNLSCGQSLPKLTKTIAHLGNLWGAYPRNQDIALEYAKGLVNLSSIQELPKRVKTVSCLKDLCNAFPKNQKIAIRYAKCLFNLSCIQELPELTDTLDSLRDLWNSFPKNQEIAIRYANGLANLSHNQELSECTRTISFLANLRDIFPKSQEIALAYAKGLFNLSLAQKLPELSSTISSLKEICDAYPKNQEIILLYARSLFLMTRSQDDDQAPTTVADLTSFLQDHPDIIPKFSIQLRSYFSIYPHLEEQYRPLLDLCDAVEAEP